MFIGLYYCCLLVMVQPLSLAWADLHYTNNLWDLFQGPIIEFRLGYPIFYLGTSKFSPQQPLNDPLEWIVAIHRLHQRSSKPMLPKYLSHLSSSLKLIARSTFFNLATQILQSILVSPSNLPSWNWAVSSVLLQLKYSQHSRKVMFVIGMTSFQRFGYGERE